MMITESTFRKIVLSLPQTKEKGFRGKPSFRVHGKIFATLHPEEKRAVVKLPLDEQQALIKSNPRIYSLMPFSPSGFTNVDLTKIDSKAMRNLVDDAWHEVAPQQVILKYSTHTH